MKVFYIDFVRQVLEQTLLEEHIKDPSQYFGGKNQVNLFSFYEQLEKEEEVNRYVEIYNDLVKQQNRTGLIMNGTLIAPENPSITNISTSLIVPMSFTCSFRVRLEDRDMALNTLNHMIKCLKGRKRDVALFNNSQKLFMVGTPTNNIDDNDVKVENGDYVGGWDLDVSANIDTYVRTVIQPKFENLGISFPTRKYLYVQEGYNDSMVVIGYNSTTNKWEVINDDGTYNDVLFPPVQESFSKYKLSISFDSQRCDEPRMLNGKEYCIISFGGSATLVDENTKLGNDMTRVGIYKLKIKAKPDINIAPLNPTYRYLEPLELPSGNNADTKINSLISNKFVNNTHTNSLNISLQYTFIMNESIPILNHWFDYGRYGIQGTQANNYSDGVTPNMIYAMREYWASWDNIKKRDFNAKIVESIDIENTESDTLTISIPLQVQGDN